MIIKRIEDSSSYVKFIRKMILLILIACAFYEVYAAETGNSQIRHPYFWKVEKNGKTSHLLGTIHEPISIGELLCSQEVQHRLEASDLVFLENNHRSKGSRKAVEAQKQWMLSKDGKEFQALDRKSQGFLKDKGISERLSFFGYKAILTNLCSYGVDDLDGLRLDERITNIAYSKGISVRGLDDFRGKYNRIMGEHKKEVDTYSKLSDVQFAIEVNLLKKKINEFFIVCPPIQKFYIIENYKSGTLMADIKGALDRLTQSQRMKRLEQWGRRNIRWVNRFEKVHKNHERIFLAGGLGHFVGSVSLIDVLKHKGYTVEPVTCKI